MAQSSLYKMANTEITVHLDQVASASTIVSVTGNDLNNYIYCSNAKAMVIDAGRGNDTVSGGNLNDSLIGGDGNDLLVGAGGNDTLSGGGGDDQLIGGIGNDVIDGGPGVDTADYRGDATTAINVSFSGTSAKVTCSTYVDLLTNVENINGSVFDDAISGGSGAVNNVFNGNYGNDRLDGGGGDDTLNGGDGDDVLIGGSGTNLMNGGAGSDTYYVSSKTDKIVEAAGEGRDSICSVASIDLPANVEDIYFGKYIIPGTNAEFKTKTGFVSNGNALDNLMVGNDGNDSLSGGDGNDLLRGGLGDDTLNGGAGADTLYGQGGKDVLTGGAGSDVFVLEGLAASASSVSVIKDFSHAEGDKIKIGLSIYVNNHTLLGYDSLTAQSLLALESIRVDNFIQGAGAKAMTANQFCIFDTNTSILYLDFDGNGSQKAVAIAQIAGVQNLDYHDIGYAV